MWYTEETWNEEVAKNAEQFRKLIKSSHKVSPKLDYFHNSCNLLILILLFVTANSNIILIDLYTSSSKWYMFAQYYSYYWFEADCQVEKSTRKNRRKVGSLHVFR